MTDAYVGKTYREVKELHPYVRVTSVGHVPFIGTCDYSLRRLNVRLSGDNAKFITRTTDVAGKTFTYDEVVEGSYEDAIVLAASSG
jgi:hypothetical protein